MGQTLCNDVKIFRQIDNASTQCDVPARYLSWAGGQFVEDDKCNDIPTPFLVRQCVPLGAIDGEESVKVVLDSTHESHKVGVQDRGVQCRHDHLAARPEVI